MLTIPEEILLLALRDDGEFVDLPDFALEYALAGAVLMNLYLRKRIDCDLQQLVVVDATPVGDDILDPALAALAHAGHPHDTEHWVAVLAGNAEAIRKRVLDRLIDHGILEAQGNRLLWALGHRRYPVVDDSEIHEVKARVMSIILTDEIPHPYDVLIIALADACAVFDAVFEMDDMLEHRARIGEIVRMDLMAQAMTHALATRQAEGHAAGKPAVGIYGALTD